MKGFVRKMYQNGKMIINYIKEFPKKYFEDRKRAERGRHSK